MPLELWLLLLGLGIGTLVGLSGIGGGSLMTPALIFLGIPPVNAIATDMAYHASVKSIGTAAYASGSRVDWRAAGTLLSGSLPGAAVGFLLLTVSRDLLEPGRLDSVLMLLLGLVLVSVAGIYISGFLTGREVRVAVRSDQRPLLMGIGFVTGIIVFLTSVGSGVLVMMFLIAIMKNSHTIVGTDLAHALGVTLFATLLYGSTGSILVPIYILLVAGSIPGVILGYALSRRMDRSMFRPVLTLIMLVSGVMLVLRAAG